LEEAMTTTHALTFPGAAGAELAARLELPAGPPRAFALFAHCFTCGKNLKAAVALSRGLAEAGIATLRFDFTGLGESEGAFEETTLATNVEDLVAAAGFLAERHEAPALLVGHSLGGAAALLAAARIPAARAVVTIAAPAEASQVTRHVAAVRPEVEARGYVGVRIGGDVFPVTRQFLAELERTRLEEAVAALGRALLICHSPQDRTIDVDAAARLYQAARHPKSFLSLDGADHVLSRDEDATYAAGVIAAWAARYLPDAPPAPAEPADGVEVYTGARGYTTTVRAGRHTLVVDEPASLGGADLGPNPYDYVLAALGACTAITLRMYADRKDLPLAGVRVRLRHDKVHAADCADCETREGRVDLVERELELEGPLDEGQRARLREIADRCPVHRTLEGGIVVRTTLRGTPEGA
jgi:uncharacterized OsmC-like protein/alpha/beta superfamily hydrolase